MLENSARRKIGSSGAGWFSHANIVALISSLVGALIGAAVSFSVYAFQWKDDRFKEMEKMSQDISNLQHQLMDSNKKLASDQDKLLDRLLASQGYMVHLSDHLLFVYETAKMPAASWRKQIIEQTPAVESDGAAINLFSKN